MGIRYYPPPGPQVGTGHNWLSIPWAILILSWTGEWIAKPEVGGWELWLELVTLLLSGPVARLRLSSIVAADALTVAVLARCADMRMRNGRRGSSRARTPGHVLHQLMRTLLIVHSQTDYLLVYIWLSRVLSFAWHAYASLKVLHDLISCAYKLCGFPVHTVLPFFPLAIVPGTFFSFSAPCCCSLVILWLASESFTACLATKQSLSAASSISGPSYLPYLLQLQALGWLLISLSFLFSYSLISTLHYQ